MGEKFLDGKLNRALVHSLIYAHHTLSIPITFKGSNWLGSKKYPAKIRACQKFVPKPRQ